MHAQVLLLATAQALFQTASVMVMTVGGLAGALVAPSAQWATAPIAAMFLGTALTTVPASLWMARVGRRTGFVTGALLGVASGLLAALGIWLGSLAVLSLGTFLVGVYQAFAQFYRFAAGEVAEPAFRPRAISLVLAGGIVAALLGPLIGRWGGPLLQPAYVGSFLLMAVVSLLAAGLLTGLRIPAPVQSEVAGSPPTPLGQIVRQPSYLAALFGAATGYGVMILAMTATPIAMLRHQHTLSDATMVIQLHVLGMFLPSFFTGSLAARFGVLRIMLTGVVLGVGWNFLYVGGTMLLTSAYTEAERGRAQAANDLAIFIVGLLCSLSAGALLQAVGWQALNLLLLPWLGLAALLLVGLAWSRSRVRKPAAIV
jgi:MFS family permease